MNSSRTPKEWQKNPEAIKTDKVQYWRNGIMLTAQMTKQTAQELVKNGSAFVICEQAIGALDNGKYAS
jgi:uncharacterized metal-binding protein